MGMSVSRRAFETELVTTYASLGVPRAVVEDCLASGRSIQLRDALYDEWQSWSDRDQWREAGRELTSQMVTLYRVVERD